MNCLLATVPNDIPSILPTAAPVYAKKVAQLVEALNRPEDRAETAQTMRALIEKIAQTPGPGKGEVGGPSFTAIWT